MEEIGRRSFDCAGGYPFSQSHSGQVLNFVKPGRYESHKSVYLFLLLSTRMDMKQNRIQEKLDGTLLLEHLSCFVLESYLGANSQSMVFGTASDQTFVERVNSLCRKLGEGNTFKNHSQTKISAKDDGLDTVGWIPFADKSPGQLIVFGQCKTGTNWRDETAKLRPENFAKKWLEGSFLVDPLRAYFVSESISRSNRHNATIDSGILFDRCRMVEHSVNLPAPKMKDIHKWTRSAKQWVKTNFLA